MDPRIGILRRDRSLQYYAFVDGFDQPETVGSLSEIEIALKIRTPEAGPLTRSSHSGVYPLQAHEKRNPQVRGYVVTVTPKVTTYGGTNVGGQYTVKVLANSVSEAVKNARTQRRDNEGRHAPSATYAARLDPD